MISTLLSDETFSEICDPKHDFRVNIEPLASEGQTPKGKRGKKSKDRGEAATHCVKDSVIDLIKYAERNRIDPQRIVLLRNSTSPIPTATHDLVEIMEHAGCRVMGIDHTKNPMEMDP